MIKWYNDTMIQCKLAVHYSAMMIRCEDMMQCNVYSTTRNPLQRNDDTVRWYDTMQYMIQLTVHYIAIHFTVTTNAPAPLLDFKVCRRTNFKLCKLSNFCHRSRWGKKAYHWWWMHRFFMKFCTFGEISWLRLIFLFKSVFFLQYCT